MLNVSHRAPTIYALEDEEGTQHALNFLPTCNTSRLDVCCLLGNGRLTFLRAAIKFDTTLSAIDRQSGFEFVDTCKANKKPET